MTENAKPDVEELYTAAQNTTNLTVDPDERGAADFLIAAAWSPSRLGSAMLRLHSEWDAAAKPVKPTAASIDAIASTMGKNARGEAYAIAMRWYEGGLINLLGKLQTLPHVRDQVAHKAEEWGYADAQTKASVIVKYWLDQTCHPCAGLKWRAVPNAPALSNRLCPSCGGTGLSMVPYGSEGKRLANYMDDCVQVARTSIKKRLHSYPKA